MNRSPDEPMRARGARWLALGAFSLLAVVFLFRNSPEELRLRLRSLSHYASQDLPVRRLGGSSAAFDRRFFIFLESVRRKVPAETAGLAIYGPAASDRVLYLSSYHLAPIPVLIDPPRVPPGWIVAVYGQKFPPGSRLIAPVSGGALLKPPQ